MEDKNKKSLGYIVGQVCCTVFAGCIMSIIVALTIKLIQWFLMI